jgi:hypothetical protein
MYFSGRYLMTNSASTESNESSKTGPDKNSVPLFPLSKDGPSPHAQLITDKFAVKAQNEEKHRFILGNTHLR